MVGNSDIKIEGTLLSVTLGTVLPLIDGAVDPVTDGTGDAVFDGIVLTEGAKLGISDGSPDASIFSSPHSIVALSNVTAVCEYAHPVKLLPVWNAIDVAARKIPSTWDPVPRVIAPPICQKIFSGLAPPVSSIFASVATLKVPGTCKIQTSVGLPSKVIVSVIVTGVVHLYRPGERVSPLRLPASRLTKSGFGRVAASTYAASMSRTALVKTPGVGTA